MDGRGPGYARPVRRACLTGLLLGSFALVEGGCADDTCIPQPLGELRVSVRTGDGGADTVEALTYEDVDQGSVDCVEAEAGEWTCAVDDVGTSFQLAARVSADETISRDYLRSDIDLIDLCSTDAAGELDFMLGLGSR